MFVVFNHLSEGGILHFPSFVFNRYMDHGSLYDILHNNTMVFDGEILLPILRDIATGVRFLHSATPQIIHADLKASNILVDERFRAKVSDFGLTQKRNVGAFGSPFWMAPEVLRKETGNTAESDVYAYGMCDMYCASPVGSQNQNHQSSADSNLNLLVTIYLFFSQA